MRKIEGEIKKDVTIRMSRKLWVLLFAESNDITIREGRTVSVPEIMRRIIKKHYKKRGEK